jgi:imidazolonepropionase-like amidohydrolase
MLLFLTALFAINGAAETIVFENVNVIPMDRERVIERQNVVVRDGRIASIGRGSLPKDAVRVDGSGKYLMPGFYEMHGHLPGPNTPPELTERVLFLYLSNGVTTVRGMQGARNQLELRKQINDGKMQGPALYLAGPQLSAASAPDTATAARIVREQKAAGYDLLKIQEGLQPAVYDEIVKTAKEVNISFGGHVPNPVGLLKCLSMGQVSIDHLDGYWEEIGEDESKFQAVVKGGIKSGSYHVPTMPLWEIFNGSEPVDSLLKREDLKYMPKNVVDAWAASVTKMRSSPSPDGAKILDLRRRVLKALVDGGGKVAFGTDSPQLFSVPGFSIHREMQSMKAAGLTNYQILSSGTRNSAEYFAKFNGVPMDSGVIAKGNRADLVLLDANPLADVSNFARRSGVMVRGVWIPEAEIQKRLAGYAN